jgi:hypothetical protein
MLKRLTTIMLVLGLSAGLSMTTYAHGNTNSNNKTPGINRRQHRQQKRIFNGANSGQLTKRETIKLEKEQREIRHDKREAKADGDVTRKERISLHRQQHRASHHIYRAKHNNRRRG